MIVVNPGVAISPGSDSSVVCAAAQFASGGWLGRHCRAGGSASLSNTPAGVETARAITSRRVKTSFLIWEILQTLRDRTRKRAAYISRLQPRERKHLTATSQALFALALASHYNLRENCKIDSHNHISLQNAQDHIR